MNIKPFYKAVLIILILYACTPPHKGSVVRFDSVTVAVEVADNYEALQRGLMFRTNLSENSGMLFVFPDESPRVFWMKNTLIPLDMIHISENGTVVDIIMATPCAHDPCPTYPSTKASKYILEVNAGFATNHGILIGTIATIKN